MADNFATSGTVLNYSGLLFDTNDTETPILNSLKRVKTSATQFAVTSTYASGVPSQPEISETASLTAPDADVVSRAQEFNVTQIFHKATGVSYAKLSNPGLLSGINVAGQEANIKNELDFQVGVKMKEMRKDVEYTILNGVYQLSTGDAVANKTRGILSAIKEITTVAGANSEIKPDLVDSLLEKIYNAHGNMRDLVLLMKPVHKRQLNKFYSREKGFAMPSSRNVGGVNIEEIVTPFGNIGVMVHDMVPAGTVVAVNLGVLQGVEQDVPGKGNFFYEELARTGAGIKGQLFGQFGLDYGPSWYHGKITGLATTYADKVYAEEIA